MDWHGPVYESIKEAPYDQAAPVPYIVDFSLTGVLTIGWDRKMQKVYDFEEANRKKVAVREWVEKTMYDRRKLDSVMLTNRTSLRTEEY